MAWVDEDGLVQPDPGNILRVKHIIRASDYGVLYGDRPQILAWHLTGNRIPYGANDAAHDGTAGMAKRISNGTARYYAHGYLSRDGVLYQVVPFNRAAIHVSGKWQGQEINRIATGIEVTNAGWCRGDGRSPGFTVDIGRADYRQHGTLHWQMLTVEQNSAILEFLSAWHHWTGAPIEDCLRGHADLRPEDGHSDPGPELRGFLDVAGRAHLEGGD